MRGVEVRCAPVGLGEAGVEGFATVDFGEGDGGGGGEPGGVGDDGLVLAVGESEVELSAEKVWARRVAKAAPRHRGTVPTAAE